MALLDRIPPARDENGEPLCTECGHTEYDHRNGSGLCLGLGSEKGALGTFCSCTGFKRPKSAFGGSGSYSDWKPGTAPRQRVGFSQSSSRTEIGGRSGARPNLQNKNPNRDPAPEWVMFGINFGHFVRLYASTSLSYMELRQEVGHFDELHQDLIKEGKLAPTPWDIRGRIVKYVVIDAKSYPEALARLMNSGDWHYGEDSGPSTADLQRQQALEDARRETEQHRAIEAPLDEIVDAELVDDDSSD